MSHERIEAIQAVVDRVSSYQDGAPEGTVEEELRNGLSAAGLDVEDTDVSALAAAIESAHGQIDASDVLS